MNATEPLHGTLASKLHFIARVSLKANSDLLGFSRRETSTEVGRAVTGQRVKMQALPQSSCALWHSLHCKDSMQIQAVLKQETACS